MNISRGTLRSMVSIIVATFVSLSVLGCEAYAASSYSSGSLKCKFVIPSDCAAVEDGGSVYVGKSKQAFKKKDGSGYGMSIPYVIVDSYKWSKDEANFFEEFAKQVMKPKYGDLSIVAPAAKTKVGGREVWQIRYEYTIQNGKYKICDTRVAIKENGRIYMVGSKEVGTYSNDINALLTTIVTSLESTERASNKTEPKAVTSAQLLAMPKPISAVKTTTAQKAVKGIKIVPLANTKIAYEQVSYPAFSMTIPRGWKVKYNMQYGVTSFTLSVVNPQDPAYQMFFLWCGSGFNQSERARDWFRVNKTIGYMERLRAPVINPANAAGFYRIFSQCRQYNSILPALDNFQVISQIGRMPNGGDVLHGSYTNGQGVRCEGFFTALVWKFQAYGVPNYLIPLSVSGAQFFTTRQGDLNNHIAIYEKCLGSLTFTKEFMQAHDNELRAMGQNAAYISRTYNEISASMRQSYENRNRVQATKSQEYSDATLGIEAVLDTDTGRYYNADIGTVEKLNNSGLNDRGRYKVVTGEETLKQREGTIVAR
ncbi:MAG: hypothetical protein Q4F74_06830 [Synergistaceae bacterium]|nr:hypothetical protein [Synergistaceae bacterium]